MFATRIAAIGATLVLTGGLAACGGSSEAEELAKESCDLITSVDLDDFNDAADIAAEGDDARMENLEKLQEFAEKGEALQKKADEAGISEKEFEDAMRAECGDEMKKFEDLAGM